MLDALKTFIDTQLGVIDNPASAADETERGYKFATAMLLVEMTRADHEVKEQERAAVAAAIEKGFGLATEETRQLVALADAEIDHTTCLHEFTRTLNDHLSVDKKRHVVELLWQVAFADGEVDKYEDHFVRKIADLLHLRHRDLIQAKHRAEKLAAAG